MPTSVSLDGLHPTLMRPRVEALLADPEAKAMGVYIVSAFRSLAKQQQLFNAAVAKYGSAAAAGKWVAPPGKSNHGPRVDGYGIAVDVGLPGVAAVSGQWPDATSRKFQSLAARHGLYQRMAWEDWHFEPIANWSPADHTEDDMTPDQDARLSRVETAVKDLTDKLNEAVVRVADAENKIGQALDTLNAFTRSMDTQIKEIRRNVRQAITLAGGTPKN